jgi:F-type H+-transporting ATPase subunit c
MSHKSKLSLSLAAFAATLLVPALAFAQQMGAQGAAAANKFDSNSGLAIAAGLAIGLAALGGTLGQGRAAAAALEGISRNPGAAARIQTPMILGLALIESLVLFAFVVAFLLQGKILMQ